MNPQVVLCSLRAEFALISLAVSSFAWAAPRPGEKAAEAPLPEASSEADEVEKQDLSPDELFRKKAPRLLFLKPEFAPDLKLDEELQLEIQLIIKNALRKEGSFRIRTMGDLEIDDEALFAEAKDCTDDACLYEALNNTAVGQFLRTRVSAAPEGGLRTVVRGYNVSGRKAYAAADFLVKPDPSIGDVGEVLLKRLWREVRVAVYGMPPAPLVDGTPPAFDGAIVVHAPTGAQVSLNGEVSGEVQEMGLLRLERAGGKDYVVGVALAGYEPFQHTVALGVGQVGVVVADLKRAEAVEKVADKAKPKVSEWGTLRVDMKVKPGADVYLDGRWIGENPLTFTECPKGPHKVVIRHPLFYRLWRAIECSPNTPAVVSAEMLPKYGKVYVSSPVRGAGVILDGDPVGRTPLWIDEVPSGNHTLQILDETWQSKRIKFRMVELRREKFHLPVRKRFGSVEVRTSTEGVTASAKGRKIRIRKGVSVLKIPPGRAQIVCQAPFHRKMRQLVSVRRGQNVKIKCDLEPVSARLIVGNGGLPGRVLVDGRVVARVPAEVAIEPGNHKVVVEPDSQSYQPFEASITVANKGVVRVDPVFAAMVGGLQVNSTPAGAEVLLDGRVLGVTPMLRKDLPVGIFSIEVRKKGYNSYVRRVVVAQDELERINAGVLGKRGLLKVSTIEPGATVVVGGVPMGVTPLVVDHLPQGLYEVVARRKGMADRVLEVEVRDNQEQRISFRRLIPLELVNAAFYDRVPAGRYLLFGGVGAVALGWGAQMFGQQQIEGARGTYEAANTKLTLSGAVEQMQAGRDQAQSGTWFEGGGYALMGSGISALAWFTLRFPWGDL